MNERIILIYKSARLFLFFAIEAVRRHAHFALHNEYNNNMIIGEY